MVTRRKINAGDPGSKKYQKKYGDKLICVRYKYDSVNRKRITTVELLEDEADLKEKTIISPNRNVLVRVSYNETELREQIKSAGGRWNPEIKLWELKYGTAKKLNITSRIQKID